MREVLTPRQVARAIDVSESSVKRWCDRGVIATHYTAGGHRRITRSALISFLRQGDRALMYPEALDLPSTVTPTARGLKRARAQMLEALLAGDEQRCRQLTIDLYLSEHSVSAICDEVLAMAFREIGDRWACGAAEVYQERVSCEMALRILHELRSHLTVSPAEAPLAIGGTAAGDPYTLGTTMAELVMRDSKWRAMSLGGNLPFTTLAAAIRQHRPKLFWLSCSHIPNEAEFLVGYRDLYDQFGLDVAFVVGGTALTEPIRQQMRYSAHCDQMKYLEGFAQALHNSTNP